MNKSIKIKFLVYVLVHLLIALSTSLVYHIVREKNLLAEQVNNLMRHKFSTLTGFLERKLKTLETIAKSGSEYVQFSDYVRMDEALPYLEANFGKRNYLLGSHIT